VFVHFSFRRLTGSAALLLITGAAAACGEVSANQTSAAANNVPQQNQPNQVAQMITLVVTPFAQGTAAPLPVEASGEQVVARVNGEPILLADFQRELARLELQQAQPILDIAAFQDSVLNLMIEQTLIDQAAEQAGITISDADLDNEIQQVMDVSGSADAWQTWLAANGYTADEFRETLRVALITGQMRDRVIGDLIAETIPFVHARHILVGTADLAEDLAAQVSAGGDFTALAAQYSLDSTTAANGGDLGWFAEDELLQPTLAHAAFNSELNQIVGPIQTTLGYHVLQVLEREDRAVSQERLASLSQARFTNWLAGLVSAATIESYLA
jgi:foldase protein PrsA